MEKSLRKVKQYLKILDAQRLCNEKTIQSMMICPCDYKVGHTPPDSKNYMPYIPGSIWCNGEPDRHAWFRFEVDVTPEMLKLPLRIQLEGCGTKIMDHPQFMIYLNGELRQGMDAHHTYTYLDEAGHYTVDLYAYTGRIPGVITLNASLWNVHDDVEALYYDIQVPAQTLDFLDPNSREFAMTLDHLDQALSLLDLFEIGSPEFFASIARAQKYMTEEFYGKYCQEQPATSLCVGHTHIDCAWKWTLQQTREKVQRSFPTVLELMRRYPEYRFTGSQPLLYRDLKEEAPAAYEEVKRMVKEGRWECEGAMWVEADCNLSSGESLVRQVLYGKRFFKEEFGVDSHVLWLPDVFGYSAALPQILRKSRVDWFVTSKIGWNDTNSMPYETFRWQGIDGTEINTYFMTANNIDYLPKRRNTYNADTTPSMIAGTYDRYKQKALSDEVMITYGYGDGGGGPTPEQLEMIRRQSYGIPGIPNARTGFASDFLKRMEKRMEGKKIPKWRGELYLEYHRGTYTSIGKNKRNNRKCEFLYQNAEWLACMEGWLFGTPFPKDKLRHGWTEILTNQFHDIIPGSSIKAVYDQCDQDYAKIREIGESIVDQAKQKIATALSAENGFVVFNPHSFVANGTVKIDGKTALVENIPQKGYACFKTPFTQNHIQIEGKTVETDLFKVCFDESMQISSIYDKRANRELLSAGAVGNELRVYPDHPDKYDNWEWQEYSLDCYTAITDVSGVDVVEDGARRGIRIVRGYKHSTITQTVWFYDSLASIDFDTEIDWHEQHLMLKAAFPVDVNADKATYEIQFGTVERPTHKNTSWDKAKFEVCAHKYADLSEGSYGVAILNDCKYGHDIHEGVIQLSLLKCGTEPNPEADQGKHVFTYALYPHTQPLAESDVAKQAYLLNNPLTAIAASGKENKIPTAFSAACVDSDHVMCETLKEAEEGEDVILRLYDYKNQKDEISLHLGFDAEEAWICNLLEEKETRLPITKNTIRVPIRGFEIVTLRVKPLKK